MIISLGAKVRVIMEKNRLLKKLIPAMIDSGFVDALYNIEKNRAFKDYYQAHVSDFEKAEKLFADELSRKTFRAVVEYRRTLRKKFLKGIPVYPQYFQKDILGPAKDEVFVDGGAYTGDTIESYVSDFGGGVTLEKGVCLGA